MKSIYNTDHLEKKTTTKELNQQTMWNMNIALAFIYSPSMITQVKSKSTKFENNKEKFNT
jgi:hypothetical protein